MKKIFALLLILSMLGAAALAEVDLSGMSFEELAALRDQCQLEMMQREDWQEVVVPQGIYEVGAQIPAGTWVIKCYDGNRNSLMLGECDIFWGSGYPDDGLYWSYSKSKGKAYIFNPNSRYYENGKTTEFIVTLVKGDYISISNTYNKAVFTPYTGINLGFK